MNDFEFKYWKNMIIEIIFELSKDYGLKNINFIDMNNTIIRLTGISYILYNIDKDIPCFDNVTSNDTNVFNIPKLHLDMKLYKVAEVREYFHSMKILLKSKLKSLFQYLTYFNNLGLNINFYVNDILHQDNFELNSELIRLSFGVIIVGRGDINYEFQRESDYFRSRNNWIEPF